MKNTKKIISIILVLMIVVMSIPIQAFAETNEREYKIKYNYIVADTNLKDWLFEGSNYYGDFLIYRNTDSDDNETFKNMLISQSKWTEKLCNDISSGKIKTFEPEDYVKEKASQSEFKISDDILNRVCYNIRSQYINHTGYKIGNNYFVHPNDYYYYKSETEQICYYSDLGVPFSNSFANMKSYFTGVGTFLGDYKNYSNSVHFFGKMDYDEELDWDNYKIKSDKLNDKFFDKDGNLIVYIILVPTTSKWKVNFADSSGYYSDAKKYILNENMKTIRYSDNFDDCYKNYRNKCFYQTTPATREEQIESAKNFYQEAKINNNDYSKYKKVVWDCFTNSATIIDKREYVTFFEDATVPFPDIEGFSVKNFVTSSNKENYTLTNDEKIEGQNIKIAPYPFATKSQILSTTSLVCKNTYTHKINFVDTEGNPINIDFRQYKYSNNFGKNNDTQNTLFININKNENPSQNDFNVSSIVWNNESNSFYNSKGELLKQDKENVPLNEDFNMFDNSFDVKISKSLLNSVEGYTFSEITTNDEKVTPEEIADNDIEYYHLNTDITKGVTTLNVVFKKKSTPNVNNNATVNVKYVDKNGKVISDDVIIKGKVNDPYETKSKKIYGYSLIRTPDNARGFMTSEPINVNYVYRLKDANVIVRYIDKENNEIEDTEVITGKVFDKYTTEAKDIDGYTLFVMPTNATGEMTEEPITVTYIYEQEPEVIVTEDDPKKPVATGDSLPMTLIVMTIITLMLCIVYVLINKKKRTNEKE